MQHRLIDHVVRRVPGSAGGSDVDSLIGREWLVTNGLGGYASGTVAGLLTRRYHGVLVAALTNPLGRMVMLNHLIERVDLADGSAVHLGGEEYVGGRLEAAGARALEEFRLEAGLPVWRYRVGPAVIEKRLVMPHRQNSVYVTYALLAGDGDVRLSLRPAVQFRGYEDDVGVGADRAYRFTARDGWYEIEGDGATPLPPLRLRLLARDVTSSLDTVRMNELLYRVEEARGYRYSGALWSPGCFALTLAPGERATLVASTESPEVLGALAPDDALALELERRRRLLALAPAALHDATAAELVLAADQFLISPAGRLADRVRAQAVGDEVRTVIAGYHWFTDWGRDTMISLDGLTLATGRHREAGFILRTFAHYVRHGLIPNMFPDGANEGLYHTADATLWFFHAVDRYLRATDDRATLVQLLPTLQDIVAQHQRGTRFGIHVDPVDGLLVQGAEGYQLTWMDAKCDGWVVTPRRGKAVEINALWYNALCLLESWVRAERGDAAASPLGAAAARACASFNRRFWYEAGGHLYDVVDGPEGESAALRPNQLLAISLAHPVLDRARWATVLEVVERRLVTPVGLRSLSPDDPEYKPNYHGDLRTRDAAYHQGTVWGWLIGPWVDAWLRVHPDDRAGARRWLDGLAAHLGEFGVGSVAEVFDAEPPFTPRGCVAQAWSVAELLRCWLATAEVASGGG